MQKRASTKRSKKAGKITDLAVRSVKAGEAAAVKGGLPAIQAAREAARRSQCTNN